MKALFAVLAVCLLTVVSALGEEAKAIQVEFTVPAEGWAFSAMPNGAIHGQYESLPGDSIQLPPGTANFMEIVALVQAAKAPEGRVPAQAAIRHKDEVSVTLKPIEDNGYFRKLFLEHRDNWQGWMKSAPNERVVKLMQRIEYYRQPPAGTGKVEINNVEEALRFLEEKAQEGDLTAKIDGTMWQYHYPYSERVMVDFRTPPPEFDVVIGLNDESNLKTWLLKRKQKWIVIEPGKDTALEKLLFILNVCNEEKISYHWQT